MAADAGSGIIDGLGVLRDASVAEMRISLRCPGHGGVGRGEDDGVGLGNQVGLGQGRSGTKDSQGNSKNL